MIFDRTIATIGCLVAILGAGGTAYGLHVTSVLDDYKACHASVSELREELDRKVETIATPESDARRRLSGIFEQIKSTCHVDQALAETARRLFVDIKNYANDAVVEEGAGMDDRSGIGNKLACRSNALLEAIDAEKDQRSYLGGIAFYLGMTSMDDQDIASAAERCAAS